MSLNELINKTVASIEDNKNTKNINNPDNDFEKYYNSFLKSIEVFKSTINSKIELILANMDTDVEYLAYQKMVKNFDKNINGYVDNDIAFEMNNNSLVRLIAKGFDSTIYNIPLPFVKIKDLNFNYLNFYKNRPKFVDNNFFEFFEINEISNEIRIKHNKRDEFIEKHTKLSFDNLVKEYNNRLKKFGLVNSHAVKLTDSSILIDWTINDIFSNFKFKNENYKKYQELIKSQNFINDFEKIKTSAYVDYETKLSKKFDTELYDQIEEQLKELFSDRDKLKKCLISDNDSAKYIVIKTKLDNVYGEDYNKLVSIVANDYIKISYLIGMILPLPNEFDLHKFDKELKNSLISRLQNSLGVHLRLNSFKNELSITNLLHKEDQINEAFFNCVLSVIVDNNLNYAYTSNNSIIIYI